jgi:hypothetical protein
MVKFLKIHENGTQSPYSSLHPTQCHNRPCRLAKHMRFQVVVTNLETHIFTMPATFHGATIGNHDLEIVDEDGCSNEFLGQFGDE